MRPLRRFILASLVRAEKTAVLVVVHSNTLVSIAKALGVTDIKPVADDEYDRLMIIDLSTETAPVMHLLRY